MNHIAVNTRLLLKDKIEGIGRFAYEILRRMVVAHPETKFTFIFDRKYDDEFIFAQNVEPKVVFPPSRHALLWYAGFHGTIPYTLSSLKVDAFFSPESYITNHKTIPQVATFHDVDFEFRPEDVGDKTALWYLKRFFPYYAHHATRIMTVSEYTKNNLYELYQIPKEKVEVVYSGCSKVFKPLTEEQKTAVRQKFTKGSPYFHFVGTMQPRKNIDNLLLAFDEFKKSYASDIKLVVAGRKGWKTDSTLQIYEKMQYKDEVVFTGFISEEEINEITAASLALCFVSFLEGFGLPPVEAMNSETAVIASRIAAIPEISSSAAHYIDPYQVSSITEAMLLLSKDEAYRQQLIQNGRIERLRFSLDESAAKTWAILEKAVGRI